MQFLHTVICTDAIVPLAASGGGAVRSNLKIGIFIGEKRRRPFGQIRPRCSTVPTSLVQGAGLLASASLETLSPYHQRHMCGLTLEMICLLTGWHGGPPPKSLDSDENFKLELKLFRRELRFVAIYALFWRSLVKKVPFWVKNSGCQVLPPCFLRIKVVSQLWWGSLVLDQQLCSVYSN